MLNNTPETVKNPLIRINKSQRLLTLCDGDGMIKQFRIALGENPQGDKLREGDKKTPEGVYYACTRNDKSKYYLSIGISYPSIKDALRGLENGMIDQETYKTIEAAINHQKRPPWDTPLGGSIMIHGGGTENDWTQGCIALSNEDMECLWRYVEIGTEIIITP